MNIIFGTDNAEKLSEKYIVLELDTFRFKDSDADTTAYCVVETVPLDEMVAIPDLTSRHVSLVESFKSKQWQDCLSHAESLRGSWSGEVDTYYENITERVRQYAETPPSDDWTHVIVK
jgi:hypothetical protein